MAKTHFRHANTLMVQGTTSDAGKSIVVTALCRMLRNHGLNVAPFKPQNMALNSAVTACGGEIGRAQAVQAEACRLAPSIAMNPILLKPNSDTGSQVIVHGKAIGNMTAVAYHQYKPKLLVEVLQAYKTLSNDFDVIMVEGAGSPAEINLREHDIANMGFAEAIDCPVVIVADIDRGGVFAHLYGTYALLSKSEQQRVVGFVINRFRGDIKLLKSGLDWLKEKTTVPVLAVLPYIHRLHIEAEDSLSRSQFSEVTHSRSALKIAVIIYPRMSNHTDFDVLRMHDQIDCQFVKNVDDFNGADLMILPGSKHVRADLAWLRDKGWQAVIHRHLRLGGKIIGICGGYQMLGNKVHDPKGVESVAGSSLGLSLLNMQTTLQSKKTLRNVSGVCLVSNTAIKGYEIHAGISEGDDLQRPLFSLIREGDDKHCNEGASNGDNTVQGSYVHGVFDEPEYLQRLMMWAGASKAKIFDYPAYRETQIERLATEVEQAWPIADVLNLLGDGLMKKQGLICF